MFRLKSWPGADDLGSLARFTGVEETTFVVLEDGALEMRWFAGRREVPLCGHGALAAAAVLRPWLKEGELREVRNLPGRLWLSRFGDAPYIVLGRTPLTEISPAEVDAGVPLVRAFDAGRDYLLIVESEAVLRSFDPRTASLERLGKIGCILASPSASATAAFRFFAPRAGILEDRASGSVIPALVEYWGGNGSGEFHFHQESGYGIVIRARRLEDRIAVTGEVLEFARGRLEASPGAL